MSFPKHKQLDTKDCGPACLKIVSKHFGKVISIQKLRELSETTRTGSNLQGLANAAEAIGIKTLPAKLAANKLDEIPLPCILHWNKIHFVVLYKIQKNKYFVSDPAHGLLTYTKREFLKRWIGNNASETSEEGVALLLEPTPDFYELENENKENKLGLNFLSKYLYRYKKFLIQLFLGLLAGSILQLIFPFLTQSIVDVGIKNQDINFIYLILAAQLFLFLGKTAIQVIRSWILLHLSTRINISLISDFFVKLMGYPLPFLILG